MGKISFFEEQKKNTTLLRYLPKELSKRDQAYLDANFPDDAYEQNVQGKK